VHRNINSRFAGAKAAGISEDVDNAIICQALGRNTDTSLRGRPRMTIRTIKRLVKYVETTKPSHITRQKWDHIEERKLASARAAGSRCAE